MFTAEVNIKMLTTMHTNSVYDKNECVNDSISTKMYSVFLLVILDKYGNRKNALSII